MIPWVDALRCGEGRPSTWSSRAAEPVRPHLVCVSAPGEDGSANIGPPDILFFALFLAAADRFGLRVALDVDRDGGAAGADADRYDGVRRRRAPRSPAISVGFLLPNADLLWRAWRDSRLESGSD